MDKLKASSDSQLVAKRADYSKLGVSSAVFAITDMNDLISTSAPTATLLGGFGAEEVTTKGEQLMTVIGTGGKYIPDRARGVTEVHWSYFTVPGLIIGPKPVTAKVRCYVVDAYSVALSICTQFEAQRAVSRFHAHLHRRTPVSPS